MNRLLNILAHTIPDSVKNKWHLNEMYWTLMWRKNGSILPMPSLLKQKVVREYAQRLMLKLMVETGTYLGDMVDAHLNTFERIHTIELDPTLYRNAKTRFQSKAHVNVWQGDSGELMPEILATINKPCLFWLDAHHSGEGTAHGKDWSPIANELQAILTHPVSGHVILVDDAKVFVACNNVPAREEMENQLKKYKPHYTFINHNDIIRMAPNEHSSYR